MIGVEQINIALSILAQAAFEAESNMMANTVDVLFTDGSRTKLAFWIGLDGAAPVVAEVSAKTIRQLNQLEASNAGRN